MVNCAFDSLGMNPRRKLPLQDPMPCQMIASVLPILHRFTSLLRMPGFRRQIRSALRFTAVLLLGAYAGGYFVLRTSGAVRFYYPMAWLDRMLGVEHPHIMVTSGGPDSFGEATALDPLQASFLSGRLAPRTRLIAFFSPAIRLEFLLRGYEPMRKDQYFQGGFPQGVAAAALTKKLTDGPVIIPQLPPGNILNAGGEFRYSDEQNLILLSTTSLTEAEAESLFDRLRADVSFHQQTELLQKDAVGGQPSVEVFPFGTHRFNRTTSSSNFEDWTISHVPWEDRIVYRLGHSDD